MTDTRTTEISSPVSPVRLLGLPDDMLVTIASHFRPDDGATERTALALRATCVRLRQAVVCSLGPVLDLDPVGQLRHGTAVWDRHRSWPWQLTTPFPDMPARTATLRDRVASAEALLTRSSTVRSLRIDHRPIHDYFSTTFERDEAAFSGDGLLGPLLSAAGRLPTLHTLTVGPLGAEVVDQAVAPGMRPLVTLRRLHLRGLRASRATEVAVGAALKAVAPNLVGLTIEGGLLTGPPTWRYPTRGMLVQWLTNLPPALALRELSFGGTLTVADAQALAVWAPAITYLKLRLYETPSEAATALSLLALPRVRRMHLYGQLSHVQALLAGRSLTSVSVTCDGVPSTATNQEPLVEWLLEGAAADVAALSTDLTCERMTLQLFGPTSRLGSSTALRVLVVLPFESAHLPHLARLPHLEHLAMNWTTPANVLAEPAEASALADFPALRSLSVYTFDFDALRPLLRAASRLPPSVATLQLMVDSWPAQGRVVVTNRARKKSVKTSGDGDGASVGRQEKAQDKGMAGGAVAPAGLRRLYFGYLRTDRAADGRASVPADAIFSRRPPGVVLAGELASPPVGWVEPPGGSAIVPAEGWGSGWALQI